MLTTMIRYGEAFVTKVGFPGKRHRVSHKQHRKCLAESFAQDCWRDDTCGLVVVDEVKRIWMVGDKSVSLAKLAEYEMDKRATKRRWLITQRRTTELAVFNKLFLDTDGLLLPIRFVMVNGKTRHTAFFDGMVQRYREGKEIFDLIPTIIRDLSNEEKRHMAVWSSSCEEMFPRKK